MWVWRHSSSQNCMENYRMQKLSTGMTRTTPPQTSARCKDMIIIQRAQKRLLRAYRRLGKSRSWRMVAKSLGINHGDISTFINHGHVPRNEHLRLAMGLPRVMPSERKPRTKRIIPLIGTNGWEKFFFKILRPRRWKR